MAAFSTLAEFRGLMAEAPGPNSVAKTAAEARNTQLTKPMGALGRLEDIAIWFAGWQGNPLPRIADPQVIVFAGNHGITAQGVSAFPAEVTEQMVLNFQHGGAAINQLSRAAGAKLSVHALDLDTPTADFTQGPAMTEAELVAALQAGWDAVNAHTDLLVVGEMGIGNTTSGAAILHALYGGEAENWVGRGTGVSDEGLELKARVVREGVAANPSTKGLEVLRCLGGRELAAMVGAIACARVERIPVVLDGFICTAAAATLAAEFEGGLDHCIAGHVSAEAAHIEVLKNLGKEPILSLDMRLGEASGGALAINIVKSAVACLSGMATFAEAGVADG